MQELAIERVKAQQTKYQEDDFEFELAELMISMCQTEPQAAELIAEDIEKAEMTLEECACHMVSYARKNRGGNSCSIGDRKARRIVREFYGIPAPDDKPPVHSNGIMDLLDLI